MLRKNLFHIIDLVLISVLFVCIYNGLLIHFPLFSPDEGRYSEISLAMLRSGDMITPRLNGLVFLEKPVGYFWLQALSFKLFGVSEWAARLPNLFLAFIGILSTYCFSCLWFNRYTARFAALILLSTPFYFGAAHYANLDLPIAIFITLSLNCLVTGLLSSSSTHNTAFFRFAYVFAGCAFLIKGLIALIFPCLIILLWMLLKRRVRLLFEIHLISGSLLFLSVVLPWCILMQLRNPQFFEIFFLQEQVGRYLSHADFNNKSPTWFFLPVLFIGALPWSALLIRALLQSFKSVFRDHKKHAAECLLLIWIVCILLFFSIPRSKLVGYVLPVLPPFAILLAHYVQQQSKKNQSTLYGFSTVFLILAQISLLLFIYFSPYMHTQLHNQFPFYLACIVASCTLCSLYLAYPFQIKSNQKLFSAHLLLAISILIVFLFSIPLLQRQSLRDLSRELKPFLMSHPKAQVVMWGDYAYDLPFYLNRTIRIAGNWKNNFDKDNWLRELTRAAKITPHQTILIEKTQLMKEAQEPCASLLLVVPEKDAALIEKPFLLIFKRDGYVVFLNAC